MAAANGARVCAFEPSYANFCKLNKNVSVNNYDDRIDCFPVALAARTGTWRFKYFDTIPGSSRGYFYRERRLHAKEIAPETEKATLHYTMDDFVATFNLPHPTMLKVDVDGEELGVIRGAGGILKSSALQTILIEIDDSLRESESVLEMLHQQGFKLESKHKRDGAIHNYILLRE